MAVAACEQMEKERDGSREETTKKRPNSSTDKGSKSGPRGESNGDPAQAGDVEKPQQPSEVAAVIVEEAPSTKRPENARKNLKRGANTGPGPVGES